VLTPPPPPPPPPKTPKPHHPTPPPPPPPTPAGAPNVIAKCVDIDMRPLPTTLDRQSSACSAISRCEDNVVALTQAEAHRARLRRR